MQHRTFVTIFLGLRHTAWLVVVSKKIHKNYKARAMDRPLSQSPSPDGSDEWSLHNAYTAHPGQMQTSNETDWQKKGKQYTRRTKQVPFKNTGNHTGVNLIAVYTIFSHTGVTSRLRKRTVYPRPSLRTKRYCSAVSYALLNFQ